MRAGVRQALAGLPLAGWLAWFLVAPLAFVVVYSFLTRGAYGEIVWTFTGANYVRVADALYLSIFLKSAILACLTTAVCLLLGFPMAYTLATVRVSLRTPLFMLLMVPFLTNFIVRVYAIRTLLAVNGPVNGALAWLGLVTAPLEMTNSTLAVAIGMITNYLPFMVLPLYVVLEKLDFSLLEAGRDLGGTGRDVLLRILLPATKAGIVSGTVLVIVPVFGEFMIPDLLGGARTMLYGNLVTEQFLKARDWPFGAALATLLFGVTLAAYVVQRRVLHRAEGASELGLG